MRKVLVVDDDEIRYDLWCYELEDKGLEDKVALISAFSIGEAERQFAAHPDIDAIVMDACVPGNRPTTQLLVRKLRGVFDGPMIAISSIPSYRMELVQAGCSYECTKEILIEKLIEILDL